MGERTNNRSYIVSSQLTREDGALFARLCRVQDRTPSWLIRKLVRDELRRHGLIETTVDAVGSGQDEFTISRAKRSARQ